MGGFKYNISFNLNLFVIFLKFPKLSLKNTSTLSLLAMTKSMIVDSWYFAVVSAVKQKQEKDFKDASRCRATLSFLVQLQKQTDDNPL